MKSLNQLMIYHFKFTFRFFQICLAAMRGIFINSYEGHGYIDGRWFQIIGAW